MHIEVDSRLVKKGDIFVAINKGHDYIDKAIEKGASLIVAEHGEYSIPYLIVENTHEYLANYLKDHYYDNINKIKIIGITGTNGKTTTAFLIHQAINNSGIKCGYIGTIGFYINEKVRDLKNTTPDILDIYKMLLECVQCGVWIVTMEVSSHALALERVKGILFDIVIFSNLTIDHLDFHETIGNYALAKQKLFKMLKDKGSAIINNDSKYKEYFLLEENNNITYGFSNSDYKINSYKLSMNGTVFELNNKEYKSSLVGKHNIYNLTCLIIVLELLNIEYEISDLLHPIGRMEIINYKDNYIIVDYAHTPDAVLNVINTIKEIGDNRIITIIGCGGNRDRTKRSVMASITTNMSDYAIFTSDNPRDESQEQIFNDMVNELDNYNYEIIENRENAIHKGIQMLENNDILLVLGKGHENYQIIKGERLHFSDIEVVLKHI